MKKFCNLIFLINFFVLDAQIWNETQYKRQEEASIIVPCVLELIQRYFKSERALKGSLAIVNLTPDPSMIALNVLYILNENPKHDLGVMVKDATKYHYSPVHVTEKAQNYFIIIEKANQLPNTILQLNRLPTWNPLANVVIFFTSDMNETLIVSETMDVLEQFFQKSVYNVNVISQRINSTILQTFTYFPYEGNNCATSVKNIKQIHECINAKDQSDEIDNVKVTSFNQHLFPKIPRQLHGCKLNISAAIQAPYVASRNGIISKGLEVEMLKMVGLKLNLNPSYRLIDNEIVNSITTANQTHGIYSDVLQRYGIT